MLRLAAADGKRMGSSVRIFLFALLLALATLAGTVGAPFTDASSAAPVAGDQTLFGMDVPSLGQLDASEAKVGACAAIVGTFADWAHTPDFPAGFAEAANKRGAVPLISWEPWDSWSGGAHQPAYALRTIAAGDHDALIDRWATEIARYGRPVMLRFAPEMNGDWLPWSTRSNDNRPGDYVEAWRRVRARFRRAGASNAIWVWNPIASYDGSTPLRGLFPGAREVDWVAVDGYNWGSVRDWGWQSYADIFAPTLRALRALAPARPVMIAETASAPGPRRPAWVTDTLRSAHADGVGAVVWFEFDKETDWRLAGDGASARAARTVVHSRGWRQGGNLAAVEQLVDR
ncbi:MAG: glycoside hydrolase family 26 protein [Solirubrobacteraceae bacterium]